MPPPGEDPPEGVPAGAGGPPGGGVPGPGPLSLSSLRPVERVEPDAAHEHPPPRAAAR